MDLIEKKKITAVFFLPSLECGGAERNTINILRNLNEEKYEASLLLAEKKGSFLKDVPSHIFVFSFNSSPLLKIFCNLVKFFKEKKPDIFVSAFPRFNAVALLAKIVSGSKTKIILTEHLSFCLLSKTAKTFSHRFIARFLFPYFTRIFYPKADAIICVSKGIAEELLVFLRNSSKIKVIYNPVADSNIQKMAEKEVSHLWFS